MANPATKKNNSRFSFIGETIAELKKVSWLSRREAFYLTGLVLLVLSEGLSHKEAARVLRCPEATVSWRIFQAKKRLKKSLEYEI